MSIKFVYILWHTHEFEDGDEDSKLLGVYSSESIAKDKIMKYKKLPGFGQYPDGFEISKYEIDTDHWEEGFVTKYPD